MSHACSYLELICSLRGRVSSRGEFQEKRDYSHKQNHLFLSKPMRHWIIQKIMTLKRRKLQCFVRHRIDNEESTETLRQTAPFHNQSLS